MTAQEMFSPSATSHADPLAEAAGNIQVISNALLASAATGIAYKNLELPTLGRLEVAPSVLPYAIGIVDTLALLAGFGAPFNAEDSYDSSRLCKNFSGWTEKAFPGAGWQGRASRAYAQRNQISLSNSCMLIKCDENLVLFLQLQADFVDTIRMVLASITALLTVAYFWDFLMKTSSPEAVEEANGNAFFCA